jgi:hypothetical protein
VPSSWSSSAQRRRGSSVGARPEWRRKSRGKWLGSLMPTSHYFPHTEGRPLKQHARAAPADVTNGALRSRATRCGIALISRSQMLPRVSGEGVRALDVSLPCMTNDWIRGWLTRKQGGRMAHPLSTSESLRRLSDADYEVAPGEPDVRGWRVIAANDEQLGTIVDLIIDPAAGKVRYLSSTRPSRHRQAPCCSSERAKRGDDFLMSPRLYNDAGRRRHGAPWRSGYAERRQVCNSRDYVGGGIGLVYHFAPDVEQDFVWLTPGSVVATVAVARGIAGISAVRGQFRRIQPDLRRDRRRDGPLGVAVPVRARRHCWRGTECRDRTRLCT